MDSQVSEILFSFRYLSNLPTFNFCCPLVLDAACLASIISFITVVADFFLISVVIVFLYMRVLNMVILLSISVGCSQR